MYIQSKGDMTPLLEAVGLSFRIGSRTLLDRVDLSLWPGRVTAVVGVNGAGKSTLLRVLAGELKPESGHVALAGRHLRAWQPTELARVRAVMTQHSNISFPFAVEEVVALGRFPHGGGETMADVEIVRAVLRFVGAENLIGRRFPTLSGGERQRVQLARALAQLWGTQGPRVLLLDEPSASLDLVHAHHILEQVKRFARRGACVLTILHDLNAAARHADEVVMLHEGRVAAQGAPTDVLRRDVLATAYGPQLDVFHHPQGPWPVVLPRVHDPSGCPHDTPTQLQESPCSANNSPSPSFLHLQVHRANLDPR